MAQCLANGKVLDLVNINGRLLKETNDSFSNLIFLLELIEYCNISMQFGYPYSIINVNNCFFMN